MSTWNEDEPLSQALPLWALMNAFNWSKAREVTPDVASETFTLKLLRGWALRRTQLADLRDLQAFWTGATLVTPEFGWQRMGNGIGLIIAATRRLSALIQPDHIIKVYQTRKVAWTEDEIPWLIIAKDGEIAEHHFPEVISHSEEKILLAIMTTFTGQNEEDFYSLLPESKPEYDPALEPQG
jgi:hypothetical protein